MLRRTIALLVTVLCLTVALPAVAQWKWRDKSGHTQYSDLPPPPGVAEQDILQRPRQAAPAAGVAQTPAPSAAASGFPASAPRAVEPELEAKRKKAEQDEALKSKKAEQDEALKKKAEEARQAAANAEACTRTQANLRTLDSGVRLTRTNAKGETEYYDDATRAAESRRLRDIIATSCR